MKLPSITLAAAAALVLGGLTSAEAGPRFSISINGGGYRGNHSGYSSGYSSGYNSGYGSGYGNSYGNSYGSSNHCAPVRLLHTCEVDRRKECRTAYDHCGRPYTYHVTVVTYRETYSNGSTRSYTRTIS